MTAGTLLVFEGLDGSGKSTQLARLAAVLRTAGHEVVETAEPYMGGGWGPKIRRMARSGRALAPSEELRWFLEQRREHVRDVIAPALAAGNVVLSDRYFVSTAAYQGARGLDRDEILRRGEAEFPVPDLVLLLELPAEEGLARLADRAADREPVFERREFQERVAKEFAALDRPYLCRIRGAAEVPVVAQRIADAVSRRTSLL